MNIYFVPRRRQAFLGAEDPKMKGSSCVSEAGAVEGTEAPRPFPWETLCYADVRGAYETGGCYVCPSPPTCPGLPTQTHSARHTAPDTRVLRYL